MTILSLLSSILFVDCEDKTETDTQEVKEIEDYSQYCGEDPSRNLIEEDSDCDDVMISSKYAYDYTGFINIFTSCE